MPPWPPQRRGRGVGATEQQAQEPWDAFRSFLDWVHQGSAGNRASEIVALVRGHLGSDAAGGSVVTREVPAFGPNPQVALDAWTSAPGRAVRVHGVVVPPHHMGLTLQGIISEQGLPPIARRRWHRRRGGRSGCRCGTNASRRADGAAVTAERLPRPRAPARPAADGRYRARLLDLPATARADIVLPDQVLRRIERHTLDVATHRDELLAASQHLKRGVLLYGPPGTGKTQTTRYLVGAPAGCTVLQLAGGALHLISVVTGLARELQPSVFVLEDVDLVAEDRGHGMGGNPMLFELLDAMDGAAADADLLFPLTTNRADVLEPALAARPHARRARASSSGRRAPRRPSSKSSSAARCWRAVAGQTPLRQVTAQVDTALDDLLDSSQQVTRPARCAEGGVGGRQPP